MRIFEINDRIKAVCEWKKTRVAFKHEATLIVDGNECETVKICYLNRTWEEYEFQSVLEKLAEKTRSISEEEKALFRDKIKNGFMKEAEKETDAKLGTIAMVAKMGEIFGGTLKEKNDWKARMLKAGLGDAMLEMPEDWNELTEEEKKKRLDAAIDSLKR